MLFIALAVVLGLIIWANVAGVPLVITLGVIALLCALLAIPKKSLGEDKFDKYIFWMSFALFGLIDTLIYMWI